MVSNRRTLFAIRYSPFARRYDGLLSPQQGARLSGLRKKPRFTNALYQGTASAVPISHLLFPPESALADGTFFLTPTVCTGRNQGIRHFLMNSCSAKRRIVRDFFRLSHIGVARKFCPVRRIAIAEPQKFRANSHRRKFRNFNCTTTGHTPVDGLHSTENKATYRSRNFH